MKDRYVINLIISSYIIGPTLVTRSLFLTPNDKDEIQYIVLNCKSKASLDSDNIFMYIIKQTIY